MVYDAEVKIYDREDGVIVGADLFPNSKILKIQIPNLLINSSVDKIIESSIGMNANRNINPSFKIKSSVTNTNYVEAINITSIPANITFDLVNKYTLTGKTNVLANGAMLSHQKEGPHPDHKHTLDVPFKIEDGIMSKLYREKIPAGNKVLVSFVRGDLDRPVVDFIYDVIKTV